MSKCRSFSLIFLKPEKVSSIMSLIIAFDVFLSNLYNSWVGFLFSVLYIHHFSLILFSCVPAKCFLGVYVSGYRQKNSNCLRIERKWILVASKIDVYTRWSALALLNHGTDYGGSMKCVLLLFSSEIFVSSWDGPYELVFAFPVLHRNPRQPCEPIFLITFGLDLQVQVSSPLILQNNRVILVAKLVFLA